MRTNILFHLLVVLFLGTSCNEIEKEKVIFPDGFRGPAIVVHDSERGAKKKYASWNCRILEIPENGILISRFDANSGYILDNEEKFFFFIESGNTLREIPKYSQDSIRNYDSTQLYGWCLGIANLGFDDRYINITSYFLGTASDFENIKGRPWDKYRPFINEYGKD